MPKPDPIHQENLRRVLAISNEEKLRRIAITDFRHDDYIASEVLAALIRAKYGEKTRVLDAMTSALHRRVISSVEIFFSTKPRARQMLQMQSDAIDEAIGYFWEKFLSNTQDLCNAEVRFKVYLENRVADYIRSQLNAKASLTDSMEKFSRRDAEDNESSLIETFIDEDADTPETETIRNDLAQRYLNLIFDVPKKERIAFILRIVFKYQWNEVAVKLSCSIPTARKLVQNVCNRITEKFND